MMPTSSFLARAATVVAMAASLASAQIDSSEFDRGADLALWTLRASLGEEFAGDLMTVHVDDGADVLVGRPRHHDGEGKLVGRVQRLVGATGERLEAASWDGPVTSERRGDGYGQTMAWLDGPTPTVAIARTRAACQDEAPVGARGELLIVDVTGAVVTRICASRERTFFGNALASIDDVDGDGRDDVIVVSGPRRKKAGGDADGLVEVIGSVSGERVASWSCPEGVFGFGAVVTSGDVNGDGVADVIVGSQRGTVADDASTDAWVHVFDRASGDVLFTWSGVTVVDLNVLFVGDVNGDGSGEVAIGGPMLAEGLDNSPMLTVMSGTDGSVVFSSFRTNARAGYCTSMVLLGDINDDDAPDFAVSEPRVTRMFDGRGRVYLVSGVDGASLGMLAPNRLDAAFGLDLAVGQLIPGGPPELVVRSLAIDVNRGELDELRAYDLTDLITK